MPVLRLSFLFFDFFFPEDVCENEPGVYGICDQSRFPVCDDGKELILKATGSNIDVNHLLQYCDDIVPSEPEKGSVKIYTNVNLSYKCSFLYQFFIFCFI